MCFTPGYNRHKITGEQIPFPCGKCPKCIYRRISQWVFRLQMEELQSTSSMFLTLTYDTLYAPFSSAGYLTLKKDDLQKFFKRLRKSHEKLPNQKTLKYFAVGEYGGLFDRPHYHIILFNANIMHVQKAWNMGAIYYGDVSSDSIAYTLKYISKEKETVYDCESTFRVMSKGLGANYLTKAKIAWHKKDHFNRHCVQAIGTNTVAMPRYYKDKIFEKSQLKAAGFHHLKKLNEKKDFEIKQKGYNKFYTDQLSQVLAAFNRLRYQRQKVKNKVK